MITRIHVNQHIIKRNKKMGEANPPITIKTYKGNHTANRVNIIVQGNIVASIIYNPNKPLDCGAHVWVETEHEVQSG